MSINTYYKNDLKRAYMILDCEGENREDYQIIMLKENDIPKIVKTDVRYVDNRSQYYYDISGKTSFKMFHEKTSLKLEDMRALVNDLLEAICIVQKYMLDGNCILLEPEYIFCENGAYFFCYYPFSKQDIREAFHRLTEFFVREVNYKDEEGVRFAYTLHKATMEENYSIEEIMKRFLTEETEEEIVMTSVDYIENMEIPDLKDSLIEERDSMWESVRRFLERSSRRKRGYSTEDL